MARFVIYTDESGKKRIRKSDETLKKEEEKKEKEDNERIRLNKKERNELWLNKWLLKRRVVRITKYLNFLRGTVPKERLNDRLAIKLFSMVDIGDTSECWNWLGGVNNAGYGNFRFEENIVSAHRVSYILVYGEIPKGKSVLHSCDNKLCANPNHLHIGDYVLNAEEREERGFNYHSKGEYHGSAKLTWKEVNEIREKYKTGKYRQSDLGKIYGISSREVSSIVRNEKWYDKDYQEYLDNRYKR